jgi:ribosomal protein L24E
VFRWKTATKARFLRIYVDNGFLVLQGKLYVRGDSKIFRFQNGKSESLFLQRKNPRRIAWTVLYRRQHKKGISEVRTAFSFTPGWNMELGRYVGNGKRCTDRVLEEDHEEG